MMKKYYKNFILCGEINYHCLLCSESFKVVEDLEKHIRWEKHRKSIKNQTYLSKYKKDNIYKIGSIFYCEHCNFATDASDQISEHVNRENHKTYKANPEKVPSRSELPKWKVGTVVLDDKINLSNEEWNSIIKKYCILCDENVQSTAEHTGSIKHIVKLIAAETFVDKEVYYRKYNNNMVFCFVCKNSFVRDELNDHYIKEHSDEAKAEKLKEKSKKIFDVDKENYTATCRICNSTMKYTFTYLYDHKNMHFGKSEVRSDDVDEDLKPFLGFKDHGKLRAELKEFGKNNFIKLNQGGSKGYCSLCDINISAHIMNFKEHVKGKLHNGHLEMREHVKPSNSGKQAKWPYKTKPLNKVIKERFGNIPGTDLIVINSEIAIKMLSFMLLSLLPDEQNFKCFLCDEVISKDQAAEHHKADSPHSKKLLISKVVLTQTGDFIRGESGRAEFIREVKSGVYHCGQCNQVYPSWKLLEKHFDCWKHRAALMDTSDVFNNSDYVYSSDDECCNFMRSLDLE